MDEERRLCDEEILAELGERLVDMAEDEKIAFAVQCCYQIASCCGIHFQDIGVLELAKVRCLEAIKEVNGGTWP
ncbi:MAG: hypothetical protein HQ559_04125 [Lentisphaerae bacterium]|nr:hypothetical protein [Lentisphaerota bacterium]